MKQWSKQMTIESKSFLSVEKQKQRALEQSAREADKAARAQITAAKKSAQEQERAYQQMVGGMQRVAIAVIALGVAAKKVFDDWQGYTASVRDLAIASGTTAEEASTLLQVLDDYEITFDDVTAAMKAMKEKGLVPTLDNLAKLSDQFLAIQDPAERLKFAQDNLGRSSKEYLNVLSQGSKVLRENASEVNKNLILTDEQIKKAERARLAVDAWADAWDGLKVSAGAALGELILSTQVSDAEEAYNDYARAIGVSVEELERLRSTVSDTQPEYAAFVDEFDRAREYGLAWGKVLGETVIPSIEDTAESVENLSRANAEYLDLVGSITDRLGNYKEQHAKIKEQLDDGNITLEEAEQKWKELADQQEAASRRMILSMLEQELSVGGLSAVESDYLLQTGLRWGIYSREAVAAAKAAQAEIRALTANLNKLPSHKSITITTNYVNQGVPSYVAQNYAPGYADGGISRGPDSGHMEMLHGDEAVIPLKNGSVPVEMKGSGASDTSGTSNDDIVKAILSIRMDEKRLAKSIAQAMSQRGG